MARSDRALQHGFRYQIFHMDKSHPLGHGCFGTVYKAKCDQLPCAAKLIHATIVDRTDPGADELTRKFEQKYAFLESIRHPSIMQYLGMTVDPESRLPVLLMELLDESLTKILERSQQPLPYCVQVDICYDIALAVAYLHSNDIIHCDLTSNNVLIIAGRRAKVSDFGLFSLADGTAPLTVAPRTLAYMSPEVLRDPPRYTKKLDCFSEGVLLLQMCTSLWPEPGPRTQLVTDSRYPTGNVEVPVLEIQRRRNHIDLIDPTHAFLPIAIDCLNYQEKDRPSIDELCQRLALVRESNKYKDSVLEHRDQIQVIDNQRQEQRTQRRQEENQETSAQLQGENRRLQHEIASREKHLQELNRQLREQEQVVAELEQTNCSLQRQVEQLQRRLPERTKSRDNPSSKPHTHNKLTMKLKWRDGGKAPFAMSRGAAAVDGKMVYFMHSGGETCSYDSDSKKWSELPKYPYQFATLAVIKDQLSAIGGSEDLHLYIDKLLSLKARSWSEVFPPMPTKRRNATAITTEDHLIVAGGSTGIFHVDRVCTVEVMDIETLFWTTVACLPHPYCSASATVCGDQLYMLGGCDEKHLSMSVLTCSVKELIQSSLSSSHIWKRVADAPAYHSTCAAINGELLAVGGRAEDHKAVAAVHKYNAATNSWEFISDMLSRRWSSFVVILPTNEMMVFGGTRMYQGYRSTEKVEIASFCFS